MIYSEKVDIYSEKKGHPRIGSLFFRLHIYETVTIKAFYLEIESRTECES